MAVNENIEKSISKRQAGKVTTVSNGRHRGSASGVEWSERGRVKWSGVVETDCRN